MSTLIEQLPAYLSRISSAVLIVSKLGILRNGFAIDGEFCRYYIGDITDICRDLYCIASILTGKVISASLFPSLISSAYLVLLSRMTLILAEDLVDGIQSADIACFPKAEIYAFSSLYISFFTLLYRKKVTFVCYHVVGIK